MITTSALITQLRASSEAPVIVTKNYCSYESIVPHIKTIRVITVDCLVGAEDHYSAIARSAQDFDAAKWLRLERKIAGLALGNIESNIKKLVVEPIIKRVHFTELSAELVNEFQAEAIILSGTLRDFDFYEAHLFAGFKEFIRQTAIPVLAICGGHQMVGQAFGSRIETLDHKLPHERRTGRTVEYQYRFVTITDDHDPIFAGLSFHPEYNRWHKHTKVLRVWQNHSLQLDHLPEGFKLLARGYRAEQQMMVRRTERQLIYSVQFHLEKSFQDFHLDNYWNHRVESRDGRLIFENFMIEALRFVGKKDTEIFAAQNTLHEQNATKSGAEENSGSTNLSGW